MHCPGMADYADAMRAVFLGGKWMYICGQYVYKINYALYNCVKNFRTYSELETGKYSAIYATPFCLCFA
jgi:hypothetical protein